MLAKLNHFWSLLVPDAWLDQLSGDGWCAFRRNARKPSIREIVRTLKITRLNMSLLKARMTEEAKPNTLSSRFGMGQFPLHSDFVLDNQPPQFLFFSAPRPRTFGTTIFDSRTLPQDMRSQAIFLVDQPHHRRYVRFEVTTNGNTLVRYNAAFFRPANEAANALVSILSSEDSTQVIDWNENSMAVIDNRRLLHGRQDNSKLHPGSIRRIAVWGDL